MWLYLIRSGWQKDGSAMAACVEFLAELLPIFDQAVVAAAENVSPDGEQTAEPTPAASAAVTAAARAAG